MKAENSQVRTNIYDHCCPYLICIDMPLHHGLNYASGAKAISVRDLDKLSACQTNERKSAVYYIVEHLEDAGTDEARNILVS